MVESTRSTGELRKEVDTLRESMDEMKTMMANMMAHYTNQANGSGAGHSGDNASDASRGRDGGQWNAGYHIPTKLSRVDFPHFNGEDLRGWLYRCEQFFEVDDTPTTSKVKLAAMHMEGRALQWHQMFVKGRLTREVPNWEEYIRALNDRFGVLAFDGPMSELVNLKQISEVALQAIEQNSVLLEITTPSHF